MFQKIIDFLKSLFKKAPKLAIATVDQTEPVELEEVPGSLPTPTSDNITDTNDYTNDPQVKITEDAN